MKKPELLSPAGDRESLEAAVRFGADAVYVGGELLQLRAGRAAFSREALADAAAFVHENGRKLYVAVNSLARDRELAALPDYARFLRDIGVDAVIVSDLGVLSVVGNAAPELERHLSTQASCMNAASAVVYRDLGVSRIVLARELSLEDIRALRESSPQELELEAFVHGAMCMAYSGRCLLSSYLTGRSGNRGECAQPCRWHFRLQEEKRPGEYFDIEEEAGFSAILSSHDLNCIDLLDELAGAGVCSFKIEGRMKTAYYVATVVNAYRKRLDGTASPEECRRELLAVKHRPYTTGFYLGELGANHYNSGVYEQECVFVGTVLSWRDGVATVRQRNHFRVGDVLEVLSPNFSGFSFPVGYIENEEGARQETAPHPNQTVLVPCPEPLRPGDLLRRRERHA